MGLSGAGWVGDPEMEFCEMNPRGERWLPEPWKELGLQLEPWKELRIQLEGCE